MATAREISILLTIQANVQASQSVTSALKAVSKEAEAAGKQLEKAFTPRLIQSQQQLQQQLFASAKALQNWLAQGSQVTRLAPALETQVQLVAARMIELSTATNVSARDLQELGSQFSAITPAAFSAAAVIEQGTSSISAMAPAMEKVNREMGSFTPNATNAQKAGQGLILSFSLSQAAAGNFSQALFGLGFSLLFVGPQMLNVVTMSTALGAAIAGIGIEKLTAHFQQEAVPTLQLVSDRMKDIRDAIAEVRGENEEFIRSFQGIVEAEGAIDSLAAVEKRAADHIKDVETSARTAAKALTSSEWQDAIKLSETLGVSWEESQRLLEEFGGRGSADINLLTEALIRASLEASGLGQEGRNALSSIARFAAIATGELNALIAAQRQGIADTAADAARAEPFDAARREIQRSFDIQQEQASSASQAANASSSQARQERIRLLRRALDDELNVQRAHIDQVRDVLDDRLDAIRDASDTEIRLIKERADASVDAVRQGAEKELDLNKERIATLKEQERDLADALKELTRRRQQAIRDVLTTEEELAALEQLRRQQGVDPSLEQEIALREARLRALIEEQEAIDDQTSSIERQIDEMEGLIDLAEDRARQIKTNRDLALDAIKRVRDEDIRAARDAADARMDAERDAADARIEQIEAVMQRQRRASEDQIAGIQSAQRASNAADSQRRRNDRDALNRQLEQIRALEDYADQQAANARFYRDVVLPAIIEIIQAQAGSLIDIIAMANRLGVPLDVLLDLAKTFFPPGNLNPFNDLQTGGRVAGPIGEPTLAIVHGGEEVVSGQTTKHARGGTSAAGVLTVILEATGQSMSPSEMRKLKSILNRSFGQDIQVHLRSRRLIAG